MVGTHVQCGVLMIPIGISDDTKGAVKNQQSGAKVGRGAR